MFEAILFSQMNHLGIITLNYPKTLNALTLDMIMHLRRQLEAWEHDPSIHAVVIKAAPGKAFCAGGDIRSLYHHRGKSEEQLQFFWHEYRLNHYIHHYPKPYIALMDGITMGGGVGISLHGSHPVASQHFVFAMPETGIGFFPDIGASFHLVKTPGALGLYLGLTGNRLTAFEAHHAKLVAFVVDAFDFEKIMDALAESDLSFKAHERVSACLDAFSKPYRVSDLSLDYAKIDRSFFQASLKETMAYLESQKDPYLKAVYEQLIQKSPLSLEVTAYQLAKANHLSLADCLRMDYCLVQHFIVAHDLYEGVRALIIDKDKRPQWQYASIDAVPRALIAEYFEKMHGVLEFD